MFLTGMFQNLLAGLYKPHCFLLLQIQQKLCLFVASEFLLAGLHSVNPPLYSRLGK